MTFLNFLLCGKNQTAVAEDAYAMPSELYFGCHDNSDVESLEEPSIKPDTLTLEDLDATESETECDYDHDSNIAVDQSYSFSCLLGDTLMSNHSENDEPVSTDEALQGSAVVGIYYGTAEQCQRTTERLSVFDAGYEYKSLDIVYCSADDDQTDDSNHDAFRDMPARWWAVPSSASHDVRQTLAEKLGFDASEPCLIVLDPETGDILSKQSVLDDIVAMDPLDETYNEQAGAIFQSWIAGLPLSHTVIGDMEIKVTKESVQEINQ